MQPESKPDWPKHWPEWVRQIGTAMETAEGIFPEWPSAEAPLWVHNIASEFVKLLNPSVKFTCDESGPRFMGALVGHQQRLINDEAGFQHRLKRAGEAIDRLDEELKRKLSAKSYSRMMAKAKKYELDIDGLLDGFLKVIEQKNCAIESALKTAAEQEVCERNEFMSAYIKGFEANVFADEGNGILIKERNSTRTTIMFLLLINWRFLKSGKANRQSVYVKLCNIFGAAKMGTFENFVYFCKRIGITFGPPGRPRKIR